MAAKRATGARPISGIRWKLFGDLLRGVTKHSHFLGVEAEKSHHLVRRRLQVHLNIDNSDSSNNKNNRENRNNDSKSNRKKEAAATATATMAATAKARAASATEKAAATATATAGVSACHARRLRQGLPICCQPWVFRVRWWPSS